MKRELKTQYMKTNYNRSYFSVELVLPLFSNFK